MLVLLDLLDLRESAVQDQLGQLELKGQLDHREPGQLDLLE